MENIFLLSSRIKENVIPFIFLVSLVNAEIGYERSDTRQDIGTLRRCTCLDRDECCTNKGMS